MKALTVYQPWATLISAKAKPYEFRGYPAPKFVRQQRIGIHASARPVRKGEVWELIERLRGPEAWTTCLIPDLALPILERAFHDPPSMPLSSMVCTVRLGDPVLGYSIVEEFGGVLNDSDRDEHANWAWPMLDVEPLAPIIPMRGLQGFWNWNGHG